MAKKSPNPAERDYHKGQFRLTYEGFEQGFYIIRVARGGNTGMDMWAMESRLFQWLAMHTDGRWHSGNDFSRSPEKPQISAANPKKADYFVLLETIVDVAAFERQFGLEGYSPTSMAPGYQRAA